MWRWWMLEHDFEANYVLGRRRESKRGVLGMACNIPTYSNVCKKCVLRPDDAL